MSESNDVAGLNRAATERVRQLCEGEGFGFVMHEAERLWRDWIRRNGHPTGAEFTCGPCAASMVACPCAEKLRSGAIEVACDWCCGALRVTKRVREAMEGAAMTPPTDIEMLCELVVQLERAWRAAEPNREIAGMVARARQLAERVKRGEGGK